MGIRLKRILAKAAPLLFTAAIIWFIWPERDKSELHGRIETITDGDSLKIWLQDTEVTIRLEGIDAPENNQPYGDESRIALKYLALSKFADVEFTGEDYYGRKLANVWVGDIWLNEEMVRNGHAWHFTKYNKDKKLAKAESIAKQKKAGIWANPSSVPPWAWRKKTTPEKRFAEAAPSPPHPLP